jgi:hypothetical protein
MADHGSQAGANVHTPYRQVFADAAARLADSTTYTSFDINKKAVQADTGEEYRLASVDPTVWVLVSSSIQKLAPFTIEDTDLTAAATSQAFAVGQLPPGAIYMGATLDVTEGFVGLTAPRVTIEDNDGIGGVFISDFVIDAVVKYHAPGNDGGGNLNVEEGTIQATLTSSVENVDQASAGAVTITVYYHLTLDIP